MCCTRDDRVSQEACTRQASSKREDRIAIVFQAPQSTMCIPSSRTDFWKLDCRQLLTSKCNSTQTKKHQGKICLRWRLAISKHYLLGGKTTSSNQPQKKGTSFAWNEAAHVKPGLKVVAFNHGTCRETVVLPSSGKRSITRRKHMKSDTNENGDRASLHKYSTAWPATRELAILNDRNVSQGARYQEVMNEHKRSFTMSRTQVQYNWWNSFQHHLQLGICDLR